MFRAALRTIPPGARDRWLDHVLGLGELPEDGSDLPRGCTPYLPCSVDVLLRAVMRARVSASDVFVDVGSGLGRALTFVHLVTGAAAIGLEVQRNLVHAAKDLAARLQLPRVCTVEGDAVGLARLMTIGSVFFFYCPFSGHRLQTVLDDLQPIARTRMLRLCSVDVPLPELPWLERQPEAAGDEAGELVICQTSLHDEAFEHAALRNRRALAEIDRALSCELRGSVWGSPNSNI